MYDPLRCCPCDIINCISLFQDNEDYADGRFPQQKKVTIRRNFVIFISVILFLKIETNKPLNEEGGNATILQMKYDISTIYIFPQTGGTETTTLTLHWAVAVLAEQPNIQEKIAQEIDDIIGRDRLPSLDDKGTLPYTEATLLELLRFGSVLPMGLPHAVLADTTLNGYKIQKGTMVMINHIGIHFDPDEWEQPEQFKPERFLNENGQLLDKLPESFLPFSCGRRVCLGEDFAKKELFLIFTWLCGRYTFYKVPGKEEESLMKLTDISGFTHQLIDEIEVCVKKRFEL